jgi:hypothetical protein
VFCPWPQKQSDKSFDWVGQTSPWLKKLKFKRSRIKTILIIFFWLSRCSAQRICTRQKNSKCRILWMSNVSPPEVCSTGLSSYVLTLRFFFVARQCACPQNGVCQFLTQKMLQPFITTTSPPPPPFFPDLSPPDYFLFPKLKMKLKGLCRCCWDPRSHNWWIKEGPKRGIFVSFSETVWLCRSLYIWQWSLFDFKKRGGMRLPHVSSIFKKISPETFGLHCVCHTSQKLHNNFLSSSSEK